MGGSETIGWETSPAWDGSMSFREVEGTSLHLRRTGRNRIGAGKPSDHIVILKRALSLLGGE